MDDLTNAIARAINAEFNARGAEYKIYTQDVEQGLVEPCFLIHIVNTQTTQYHNDRYNLENLVEVLYFPRIKRSKSEMYDVGIRLLQALRLVEYEHKYSGSRMNYEITDGILHFFVNYDFTICNETEDLTKMEALERSISYGK